MSYKIRNWSTSNCGANPSSAAGEYAQVMASITPSRDARGSGPGSGVGGGGPVAGERVRVIGSTEKEEVGEGKAVTP